MWTCKACGLSVMFKAVTPEIDAKGLHFICPGCNARNKLINVSKYPEHIDLAQPK